jgi:hypothetical protein
MNTTLRKAFVAFFSGAALAGAVAPAFAVDLGVQSKVWPITEVDMRIVLMQQMAKANLGQKQADLQNSTKNYIKNMPPRNLPLADKSETVYMDPSIQLANDINVPTKNIDGTYSWQTMYHKGEKVNPLQSLRPSTAILFFDGSNEEQRAWAAKLASSFENRVMPVDVTGVQFEETAKAFGRPVFYATDQQLERFQVTKTPTLVYPGSGQYSLYLAITTFARPYTADAFHRFWPDAPAAASVQRKPGATQ